MWCFFSHQSFIPKTLEQVNNVEEDVVRLISGKDTTDMYYQSITGLRQALGSQEEQGTGQTPEEVDKGDSKEEEAAAEETGSDDEGGDDPESEGSARAQSQHAPAVVDTKTARKENRKKVKEEKREARKNKVPKAVKKRREKLAKSHKR